MWKDSIKKPAAYLMIGAACGTGVTLGGQALMNDDAPKYEQHQYQYKEKPSNFDIVPFAADGDVVITEHGKKYHYEGCHTLSNSRKLQRVNSSDAINAGIGPCSKCQ